MVHGDIVCRVWLFIITSELPIISASWYHTPALYYPNALMPLFDCLRDVECHSFLLVKKQSKLFFQKNFYAFSTPTCIFQKNFIIFHQFFIFWPTSADLWISTAAKDLLFIRWLNVECQHRMIFMNLFATKRSNHRPKKIKLFRSLSFIVLTSTFSNQTFREFHLHNRHIVCYPIDFHRNERQSTSHNLLFYIH